jgi:hypothetical protein
LKRVTWKQSFGAYESEGIKATLYHPKTEWMVNGTPKVRAARTAQCKKKNGERRVLRLMVELTVIYLITLSVAQTVFYKAE